MTLSFPQADAIIEQLTTRIHELLGEEYRDVAVDAADRAEGHAIRAETAADNAEVGIRDDTVTKQHLTPGLRDELDGKADQEAVDEAISPRGLHGTLIVDPIVLDAAGVTIMFPRPATGETTVRVDYSSVVTGNLALIGFMFRGPDGEKALDGMSGLVYSTSVGEPYSYMPVEEGARTVWSHTVTPDEGWTLDGILLRSWANSSGNGSGNITIHAFAADDGSNPLVVTRDFYGGIAVPEVPVSPASATSRKWVVEKLEGKADQQAVAGVLAELDGKADKDHTHTATQVGARPDTWTPTAQDVGARPADWVPTAAQVGARPVTWTPTAAEVGAATPGYVDSRIQLVTSWPASPTPGVLYLMEEG